jgi:integrase
MNDTNIYTDEALQNLENWIEDYSPGSTMNDQMTLLECIDLWLETFKKTSVRKSTYERLCTSRKTMSKYPIAEKKLGDINFFDVQRYINSLLEDGFAMTGIKKLTQIVTAPLKQAAAMKIIHADPTIGVKLPSESRVKKQSREIVAYTDKEQDKISKKISVPPYNVGYLAVGFMIETGIRSGELLALKWKDVQIQSRRLHVHATIINPMYNFAEYQDSPKSKSSNRIIPLTPKAIAILNILLKSRKTEWVFEQDGERYTYQKLSYQTKKLCRECGIKFYGEHAFRHTFATNCYYKGIDVKILSRLMGHSSVQVTYNIYINLYGDGFDDMYAALCM